MNLAQTVESFGTDDQSWLGSAHGTDAAISGTLDVSAFTSGTHYPNGYFPSGTNLVQLDSGLWGPYVVNPNEVQTLTIDATGGTYNVTLDGEATGNLTYANTTGDTATLQAALNGLSNLASGDVVVTRGTTVGTETVFTLTYGGARAGADVPEISVTESLTGGAGTAVAGTGTAGGSGTSVTGRLTGHLLCGVKSPSVNTIDIQGAVLLHGRVVNAKLPIAVDATFKASAAGRITYV